MGAGHGLEVRDPTLDKRVLEFCLAVPDGQYQTNNDDRYLIRRAMQGLLPDDVRYNSLRRCQAADIGRRILQYMPEMDVILTELSQSQASGYVDVSRMQAIYAILQQQVEQITTRLNATILLRGVMASLFIRQFDNNYSLYHMSLH